MNKKYKVLNGKDYFYKGLNNKIYNVNICDSKFIINEMIKIFNIFLKKKDNEKYLGIDFEFNKVNDKRTIALCQLNLEDSSDNANIFLFYPLDLSKKQIDIFKKLLIDKSIIKILHGGESLDIPYLFDNILTTKKNQNLFCLNFVDTRYLCEYYHLENNNIDNKCKINFLLLEMNVISKKQFDFLEKQENKMGPIYEIIINVNNLSDLLILYTLTDVLYLPDLLKKFPKNDIYQKIVPQVTSFSFNIKRIKDFNNFTQTIAKYNINYIKTKFNIFQLNMIFNSVFYLLKDNIPIFNFITEINYFKKIFEIMVKYYLYNYLIEYHNIRLDNKNIVTKKILLDLKSLEDYIYLLNFLDQIKLNIKKMLN